MGKLLRVLIVIIFLLGLAAGTFAYLLFEKRVEFATRLDIFEKAIPRIATWIAQDSPNPDRTTPQWEARDVDDVTSRPIANPNRSPFWSDYKYFLEMDGVNDTMMSLFDADSRRQLRRPFQTTTDANGNEVRVIDEFTGKPKADGPGTMQELVDRVATRAQAQYKTLTDTRLQLTALRQEHMRAITDLNNAKAQGRRDKQEIDRLNGVVSRLEDEKAALETRIRQLNATIAELNDEIAELNDKLRIKGEEFDKLNEKTQQLDAENKRLRDIIARDPKIVKIGESGTEEEWRKIIPVGDKGTVVEVNNDLNFVILKLDESFTRLILGENLDQPLPSLPLMIRRPGLASPSGEFVTRVRIRQVVREKNLYIADILTDWTQSPVEKGDIAFFN